MNERPSLNELTRAGSGLGLFLVQISALIPGLVTRLGTTAPPWQRGEREEPLRAERA